MGLKSIVFTTINWFLALSDRPQSVESSNNDDILQKSMFKSFCYHNKLGIFLNSLCSGGTSGSLMLLLLLVCCCRLFREFFCRECLLLVLEIPLETFLKHFLTNIIQATSNSSQQVSKLAPINKLNVPPTSQSKSMVPYPRSSRMYSYSRFWNEKTKIILLQITSFSFLEKPRLDIWFLFR